ncbi:homoserine dehydrogenase [Haloferula helveola]|uniref:Homoserine dehydrogenase n=1 Tax=Haloferula helveola TaxID=490095 RepID=A0ABN6H8B6_9BACT|nr:homoserine dehydrogenase [Haloferula helveola]
MNCSTLGIGLAGLGTVGSGVVLALQRNSELISDRTGGSVRLDVARVLVRDLGKSRPVAVPADRLTTEWKELVDDPAVDIVVELIGGTDAAFDIVAAALRARKPVVTGNKALLAERGTELFKLSREFDTPIHFEAAVAGGIPIIKTVQESFVGNRIQSMSGIINGTSNYILERMTTAGLEFSEALSEAQQLGYAEADPALDVNGWDAAHKAILLATLAYGFPIDPAEVHVAGIEQVRPIDIEFATRLGYVVKLLAVIREHPGGEVELRVQPSFIAKSHILASVHGVFNAVAVHGDAAGESLFYGRGAGQDPTASSVVADLVEAARSLRQPNGHRGFLPYRDSGRLLPVEETTTAYYVRFDVTDRPGVIAEVAKHLADAGIGISGTHSPVNPESPDADFVDMVFQLHSCPFGLLQKTLREIENLDCINSEPVVFRIEKL